MNRLIALLFIGFLLGCGENNQKFVLVEKGDFRTTLTETGELQAVRYTVVPMPSFNWNYGRPKVTQLEVEGTRVEKGDVVGQIETSGVVQERGRKETNLAIERANLNQMVVQQDTNIKELEAKIQSAESALRQVQIDQQRVRFESETRQKLKALELKSKTLVLEKLKSQLNSKRIEQAEDLHIQKAKIRKIESDIEQANATLERFTLRAPSPGIVEYQMKDRRTRVKVAVGDQYWPGTPIIGLPDLSRMKVAAAVNEIDIDKIALHQKVVVRLDAFPKIVFDGDLTEISRISREKSRDDKNKVFDVEVLLGQADPILKPGMTVSCEFMVAHLDEALFVRNDCIHREGEEYVVYVKNLWSLKRVPVKLGPRNAKGVVIWGDIEVGDQVVLGRGAT
jgi:RND family efflux transporter MFP subunit